MPKSIHQNGFHILGSHQQATQAIATVPSRDLPDRGRTSERSADRASLSPDAIHSSRQVPTAPQFIDRSHFAREESKQTGLELNFKSRNILKKKKTTKPVAVGLTVQTHKVRGSSIVAQRIASPRLTPDKNRVFLISSGESTPLVHSGATSPVHGRSSAELRALGSSSPTSEHHELSEDEMFEMEPHIEETQVKQTQSHQIHPQYAVPTFMKQAFEASRTRRTFQASRIDSSNNLVSSISNMSLENRGRN